MLRQSRSNSRRFGNPSDVSVGGVGELLREWHGASLTSRNTITRADHVSLIIVHGRCGVFNANSAPSRRVSPLADYSHAASNDADCGASIRFASLS